MVAVRLVVLAVPWIEDHESVRRRRAANNDAVHSVSHVLASSIITIFLVMKETKQEKRGQCVFIMSNAVDDLYLPEIAFIMQVV